MRCLDRTLQLLIGQVQERFERPPGLTLIVEEQRARKAELPVLFRAAWITLTLSESRPPDPAKMATVGAMVAGAYALVGALLTQWLPEPPRATQPGDDAQR